MLVVVVSVCLCLRARGTPHHIHTPLTLTYVNLKAGISMEVCGDEGSVGVGVARAYSYPYTPNQTRPDQTTTLCVQEVEIYLERWEVLGALVDV